MNKQTNKRKYIAQRRKEMNKQTNKRKYIAQRRKEKDELLKKYTVVEFGLMHFILQSRAFLFHKHASNESVATHHGRCFVKFSFPVVSGNCSNDWGSCVVRAFPGGRAPTRRTRLRRILRRNWGTMEGNNRRMKKNDEYSLLPTRGWESGNALH